MKSVGIQYVEAIHRLKKEGFEPTRTVHLTFVPDEEIGGVDGMGAFLESEAYGKLKPIAFALDEGLANPGKEFTGSPTRFHRLICHSILWRTNSLVAFGSGRWANRPWKPIYSEYGDEQAD